MTLVPLEGGPACDGEIWNVPASTESNMYVDLSALHFWIQLTDRPSLARADLDTARGWGRDPQVHY